MKITSLIAAGVLVGVLLAACGDASPGAGGTISGITWQLSGGSVDGVALTPIANAPVTIEFGSDGSVGGVAACNSYGATASVNGSDISFPGPISQTEMACLDDGVMDLESSFLGALARVTAFTAGADSLVMTGDGVELRFAVQPPAPDASLVGTPWVLDTLVQGESASTPVTPASIRFSADGTVSGTTGCNSFGGDYDTENGFGPLAATLMACEDAVSQQEAFVFSILVPGATVTIEGDLLTIADLDGNALIYRSNDA